MLIRQVIPRRKIKPDPPPPFFLCRCADLMSELVLVSRKAASVLRYGAIALEMYSRKSSRPLSGLWLAARVVSTPCPNMYGDNPVNPDAILGLIKLLAHADYNFRGTILYCL